MREQHSKSVRPTKCIDQNTRYQDLVAYTCTLSPLTCGPIGMQPPSVRNSRRAYCMQTLRGRWEPVFRPDIARVRGTTV